MSTIRIVLADDHPVVREGLRGMLVGQPDFAVVGRPTMEARPLRRLCNYNPM